jgi:hypothetical protein
MTRAKPAAASGMPLATQFAAAGQPAAASFAVIGHFSGKWRHLRRLAWSPAGLHSRKLQETSRGGKR